MRQRFTLLSKTLLLLCALMAGSGSAWAEDVTVTKTTNQLVSANGWDVSSGSNIGDIITSFSLDDNITISTSGDANCGSIWGSSTYDWRLYQNKGGDVTVTAAEGYVLKSITFTFNINNSGTLLNGSTSVTSGTAISASGSSMTFTVGGGSDNKGQIRITSFSVTYAETVVKADPALSFNESEYSCDLLKEFTAPTLNHATGWDGTATYESSNEDVVYVDDETGEVLLLDVGTVTITASAAATDNFKAGSARYTLTVTVNPSVDPVNPAVGGNYVQVTSEDDLEDGGRYIIVCKSENVAMGAQNTTYRDKVDITFDTDGTISTLPDGVTILTLEETNLGWYLSTDDGYIYSTATKTIKTSQNMDVIGATYLTSIGISSGNASISFGNISGNLKYNAQSPRFTTYSSGQTAIQLYKEQPASSGSVTLSSYGYKTLVSTTAFQPEGATAYIVTAATETEATLTSIDVVPANEPVILKGEAGVEVTLTVKDASEASDASGNLLEISDEYTGDGVYVLAVKDNKVNFYKWDGGSLGAGRVYLPASTSSRQFLAFSFADDTQGISATLNNNGAMNNVVYDLQGRRVAKPTKGLYIVNGKKVLVK